MLRSLVSRLAPLIAAPLRSALPAASAFRHFHLLSLVKRVQVTSQEAEMKVLLRPTVPLVEQVAGFKVKGRLRRRCKDCYFVMRQERLYVICKTHPRHKQMAMKKRDYKSWILTHATQSKVRPY